MATLPPADVFATEWPLEDLFADHDAFAGVPPYVPDRTKPLERDMGVQRPTLPPGTAPLTAAEWQLPFVDIHGACLLYGRPPLRRSRGAMK